MTSECIFLAKLYQPLPYFILYSKAKFTCYSRYLLTCYFYIPVCIMKRTSFRGCQFQNQYCFYPSKYWAAILWSRVFCVGQVLTTDSVSLEDTGQISLFISSQLSMEALSSDLVNLSVYCHGLVPYPYHQFVLMFSLS